MSYRTVEVEIDHGRVSSKDAEALPDKASGLLTLFPTQATTHTATPTLSALEALQAHLHLDAAGTAQWMASVREARR